MENKLDLSRLTDEEAKHVWEVIQRDFNLRKAEEERLGELKTKIEKEDTKRELLGTETQLADSHCIRCLQPFKFLVNSKRQCLDCKLFTCKACSRYNKKEHGWVCDPCRMTRVLKIGTAGWYHDNVRTRFKRFGSAKVMRSLCKRLNGEGSREDDTHSMPDVRGVYNGHDDDFAEAEAQRYKMMRKNKRLLSVHPLDFDVEEYYPPSYSRRQSYQQIQEERGGYMDHQPDMYHYRSNDRMSRRKSLDRYAMRPADDFGDQRMVRARSLSKISSSVARQQYIDTSEEEELSQRYPPPGVMYPPPPFRRRPSRASSQENLGHVQPPPINELNKRMSAIEGLLNRLEEKMTAPGEETATLTTAQIEEEKLRRKLSELTGNISDKGLSSDEDGLGGKRKAPKGPAAARTAPPSAVATVPDPELSSSSDEMPTEAQKRSTAAALCDITTEVLRTINATESAMVEHGFEKPSDRLHLVVADVKQADDAFRELEENVYMTAGKSFELERRLRSLEESTKNRFGVTTDSEMSELEDVMALAAARVQSTESEVSDIENKIAALSAAGSKKKITGTQQRKRFTPEFPPRSTNGSPSMRKSMNM
ncbi:melanophilin a [Aplochiton taeniatus]